MVAGIVRLCGPRPNRVVAQTVNAGVPDKTAGAPIIGVIEVRGQISRRQEHMSSGWRVAKWPAPGTTKLMEMIMSTIFSTPPAAQGMAGQSEVSGLVAIVKR
jgi:hypothetical protein